MSLLEDIILEEEKRNNLMRNQYEVELSKLPKGSIVSKKVGNYEYYYLKYRKGKKVITDYIGRYKERIEEVRKQLEKRKHFEIMLTELSKEYELIQRVKEG